MYSLPFRCIFVLAFVIANENLTIILFYFILFYFILFYFILFYFILFYFILFYFILLSFATRARSPQQREPITVGPYYLTHPVNFPCGRKPEYPEKTHDFRQSVILFSHEDWVRVHIKMTLLGIELGTLEVKDEWSDHYTTEAPKFR